MTKATIIFAVIILAFVYVQAEPPPKCPPMCHKDEHSPVKCVRVSSTICRKMRQCSIDEANCKRRLTKQRLLTPTSLSRCRNIKGDVGSGRCAKRPVRKSRSTCKHLECDDHSKVLRCYRSKRNNCRLLTVCGAKRLNCRRGWTNVVRPVDKHQCAGLRPGKKQRCRTLKKEE